MDENILAKGVAIYGDAHKHVDKEEEDVNPLVSHVGLGLSVFSLSLTSFFFCLFALQLYISWYCVVAKSER